MAVYNVDMQMYLFFAVMENKQCLTLWNSLVTSKQIDNHAVI
jgi:hypothetical protein